MTRLRTWSLLPLSTIVVAFTLVLLVLLGSAFAFNSYIASLKRDARELLAETTATLRHEGRRPNAVAAGHRVAGLLFSPTLIVVFIGRDHRVTVFHDSDAVPGQPHEIAVRDRDDRTAEPDAEGGFARLILGFASICGLQVERSHYGSLDLYVKANDRTLVENIRGYAWPLSFGLLLALLASAVIARFLTIRALRPLLDVTAALERFSAGDFRAQFVATSSQQELGRLARAYNGAVAQVERAFGERERANALMRQFIADAGHQLRTPLTVIRGFVAILADPSGLRPAELARILPIMTRQIMLMRVLIDNLVLLDRWESETAAPPMETVDFTQLVEDLTTLVRDTNEERKVDLRTNGVGLARADPHEMTYAILNVLENAIKYTTGGVNVTVDVSEKVIAFVVSDEGPGMNPDVALHAFDRFFRGERRDIEGSGLGLAIARKAIERAGGSIALDTSPSGGTTVRIELPRLLPIADGRSQHAS